MNKKRYFTMIAAGFLTVTLMAFVVSAYTFSIDEEVKLEGTTFEIDGEQFKEVDNEVKVYLEGTWYEICQDIYTRNGNEITLLEDADCVNTAQGPVCHGGGGCGT